MTELETILVSRARAMHDKILPCLSGKEFENCFTRDSKRLYFWFNTEDRSTHVIAEELDRYEEQLLN